MNGSGGVSSGNSVEVENTCLTCGKMIPVPNRGYGISPDALCQCCRHDRRPKGGQPDVRVTSEANVLPETAHKFINVKQRLGEYGVRYLTVTSMELEDDGTLTITVEEP